MQRLFESLTPKAKSMLAIGGTVAVVGGVVAIAMDNANLDQPQAQPTEAKVEAIFTDEDPRALGIDALAIQIRSLQNNQAKINELMSVQEQQRRDEQTQAHIAALEKQIQEMRETIHNMPQPSTSFTYPTQSEADTTKPATRPEPPFIPQATSAPDDVSRLYASMPAPGSESNTEYSEVPIKIRTIRSSNSATQEAAKATNDNKDALKVSLPAGAILSGVLVTGMDAPTGKQAQKDPYPSLIRIKSEAILPNRFRADFRECFIIAAGWGERSSERAYMRAERLSCIRNDGATLETSIDAYVTGEDGKTGIRGRLVSKQGQLLTRALMAGFAEGATSLFNVRQTPSLSISSAGSSNTSTYEQVFSAEAVQGATVRGIGGALERLAEYYMDMAEEMFPVIEIDAMREVDFIVKKGLSAQFDEQSLKLALR